MGSSAPENEGISVPSAIIQTFLIGGVFYLWSSPLMQPVKIMVVLFHEMSHGLMALASGGKVLSIIVAADEGGACETEGGLPFLIVSAGYLGSMFFGGLLLYLSRFRRCVPVVYVVLTLTLGGALSTVLKDPYSRTFATGLAGSFLILGLLAPGILGAIFLRILGTVSCLYSILDIYWDVLADQRSGHLAQNDAAAFASLTGIPAQTVGLIWLAVSTIYFLVVLKIIVSSSTLQLPAGQQVASAKA